MVGVIGFVCLVCLSSLERRYSVTITWIVMPITTAVMAMIMAKKKKQKAAAMVDSCIWLVWFVGYGERLSVLDASVNTVLELSFQKACDLFAFHENAGGFVSIGENDKRTSRRAESVDSEKGRFIGLEVARLADGVACHGRDRVASAGGSCKNSFDFSEEKKTAHFLLYA